MIVLVDCFRFIFIVELIMLCGSLFILLSLVDVDCVCLFAAFGCYILCVLCRGFGCVAALLV